MAKTTAPLFSFSASGQLAKSIVYFGWKGIDVVRSYVIPANPKSTAQGIQRQYLEDAVDEWHLAKYLTADKAAWNRYAGILARAMSGFNAFCKSWIDIAVAAVAPNPPWDSSILTGGAGLFNATCHVDGVTPVVYCDWGYSKTAMNTRETLVQGPAGTWSKAGIAATVGLKVVGRFSNENLAGVIIGKSGIFELLVV